MSKNRIPVLLLKTRSTPVDGYADYFTTLDVGRFQPTFVPVLEHRFTHNALETVKDNIKQGAFLPARQLGNSASRPAKYYGGLIFTSQRAVEAFTLVVEQLRQESVDLTDLLPATLPVYVVGPATARALRRLELPCQVIGDGTGNGEALAVFMLEHYNSLYQAAKEQHGSRPGLLFMVGEQRRDIIPKSLMSDSLPSQERIDVEELTVYETGVMASFAHDFAQLALPYLQKGEPQWVVVFSPTGCKAMLEVLGILDESSGRVSQGEQGKLRNTYVATIGPTTRDFLRTEFGFEPDVCAETPSAEGLGEGMLAFERR